jgi:hypothetical protein
MEGANAVNAKRAGKTLHAFGPEEEKGAPDRHSTLDKCIISAPWCGTGAHRRAGTAAER